MSYSLALWKWTLYLTRGGDPRGDYIQTLDMTDICTGWTETRAVKNKAQVWVFTGIEKAKERFPFEILGVSSLEHLRDSC